MNTAQILTVIPYCQKDVEIARKLLLWIQQLSPKLGPHCCLLAADALVPHDTKIQLGNIAKSIFYHAETIIVTVPSEITTWPQTANAMFHTTAKHIQECFKMPWLWCEPDCIPLKPSWLDELAVTYHRCPKRFMGAHITANQPPMPPVHMTGCAIHPPDTAAFIKASKDNPTLAWDIATASYAVPRSMNTTLIHHVWGEPDLPPTFKETKEPGDSKNTCTLDFIRPGALLFHRSKDGTLIDLLSKAKQSEPVKAESQSNEPAAPAKRGPGRPRKTVSESPA